MYLSPESLVEGFIPHISSITRLQPSPHRHYRHYLEHEPLKAQFLYVLANKKKQEARKRNKDVSIFRKKGRMINQQFFIQFPTMVYVYYN